MTTNTNPLNLQYDKKGLPRFKCRRIKCRQMCETNKDTLCKKCKSKDKANKRKIIRNQRKIGIKQTRKRKKLFKPAKYKFDSNPISVIYAKKDQRAFYTKYHLAEKWVKVSRQKFSALERKYPVLWNPIEKKAIEIEKKV